MAKEWHRFNPVNLQSPVLSLCADEKGVWAGGLGGVARYSKSEGWKPLISGLPLRSVAALANVSNYLIAGGAGGVARSYDGGKTWEQVSVQGGSEAITSMALSPQFSQDETALAATLDNGILRSSDQGRSWVSSNFGLLSQEVMSVVWGEKDTVIAATVRGLYRSPNAGRAWRVCPGTESLSFAALARLPDGSILAAQERGGLYRSADNGSSWTPYGDLPGDIRTGMVVSLSGGEAVLGSIEHGIMRSTDGGATWTRVADTTALSLAVSGDTVYAGTDSGVLLSEDKGATWTELPTPPLHDLRRLLVIEGRPLVAGINSPAVRLEEDGSWSVLEATPQPTTAFAPGIDHSLWASSPDGLFRSLDSGDTWQPVVQGNAGSVTLLTFLHDGRGWAGGADGTRLLRTADGGDTWETIQAPWGVLSLVALQAMPGALVAMSGFVMAGTFDTRQQSVAVWRSGDGGETWDKVGEGYTSWPAVGLHPKPAVMSIGNMLAVQQPGGRWQESNVGETGIRRVVGEGKVLLAFATNGIWRSENSGATWDRDDEGLDMDQVMDIAVESGTVYVLLSGGEVWSRPL